jgi:flagellar protein FlbD
VIQITRFNGTVLYINAELIKTVEPTPDAVITLTTGEKMVVKETAEVVVERIIAYQRMVHANPFTKASGE